MLNKVISSIYPEMARQKKKASSAVGAYNFPSDLGSHYMHLFFEKYAYAKRLNDPATQVIPSDSIALPLPENIQEVAQIRVRPDEIGLLGGELGTSAPGAIRDLVSAFKGESTLTAPGAETVQKYATLAIAKLGQDVLKNIAPGLQKGLEAGSGLTFNPYQTLTFDGVGLKEYVFDWTLAPSTRKETNDLRNIITVIKKHIHPAYGAGNDSLISGVSAAAKSRAFLQYPDILNIVIYGSQDGDLPRYKPAMVSNFTVNYVGGGEMAFLEGGAPAAIKLTMSITEMEIWTREDYDSDASQLLADRQASITNAALSDEIAQGF